MGSQRFAPPHEPHAVFGRAWHIAIDSQRDSEDLEKATPHYVVSSVVANDETPLHVVFSVDSIFGLAYWTADLTIYNLARTTKSTGTGTGQNLTVNTPLYYGDTVSISAGYQQGIHMGPSGNSKDPFDPDLNLLFSGRVFQPIWTRVNVVDNLLKLRLVFGLMEDQLNLVSLSRPKGTSDYDTVLAVADKAGIKVDIGKDAEEKLRKTILPRTQVLHDKPYHLFRDLLKQNNLHGWTSNPLAPGDSAKLHIRSFLGKEEPAVADITYGPSGSGIHGRGVVKSTLIGTPEETYNGVTYGGVTFRVLLDPDIKIGMVVELAPGTLVNPYEFPFQQQQRGLRSSDGGLYIVTGVRHFGDSRGHGEDWYSEITASTRDWFKLYQAAATPTGDQALTRP